MDHTALWCHIGQDFRDVGNHAPDNFLHFSLLDVPQKSPTTQQLGLQAALRLLARCRCSDCDIRKVNLSAVAHVAATPFSAPAKGMPKRGLNDWMLHAGR